MNRIAAVLSVALVATIGVGAMMVASLRTERSKLRESAVQSQSRIDELSRSLKSAEDAGSQRQARVEELTRLLSEAATEGAALKAKVTEQSESLATERVGAEVARTRLADVQTRLEAQEQLVAKLQAQLQQQTAVSDTVSQTNAALASLLKMVGDSERLVDVDVSGARDDARQAERAFLGSPTSRYFEGIRTAYSAYLSQIEAARTALAACNKYCADNDSKLSAFSEQVASVKARVQRGLARLQDAEETLRKSRDALRSTKYAALANDNDWQDTDMSVEKGEQIAIAATGQWRWAKVLENSTVGPRGTNGPVGYRVNEELPNGCLRGRIRGSETRWLALGHITPDRAGRIELSINDSSPGDNTGTIEAQIWIVRPLPPQ